MGVSLSKGQQITLDKQSGGSLEKVIMGLGWDAKKKKGFLGMGSKDQEIDLDASCVLFSETKNAVDAVWFSQLASKDGSIVHTGDNRTGAGEGDDEQIIVDLPRVPSQVKSLVFVVNSFTGQNFSQIENAFCHLVDARTNQEIARYDLTGSGEHNAQVMAVVWRDGENWKLKAVGEIASGRNFVGIMPAMQNAL